VRRWRKERVRVTSVLRLSVMVVAAITVGVVASACGGDDEPEPLSVIGEEGLLYDVEGQLLYLECEGQGTPTVVLEAGLGGDHRDWKAVAPELGRGTRTCSYDRAALAFSQQAKKRATAREKVDDLHRLLDVADVDGPYVLVGHSLGGMLARLYASEHRDDVAGVVLVDSSSPEQGERELAALPPRRAGESQALSQLRSDLADTNFPNPEGVHWGKSAAQVRGSSLEGLPLIVITAGLQEGPSIPFEDRLARVWASLQSDLAALSTNAIHVVATNSGHFVQALAGQPEIVLAAIREVVAAARDERDLAPCEQVFRGSEHRCVVGG
jgi:pimeloyl-ACP methyl ester carboxylesterase